MAATFRGEVPTKVLWEGVEAAGLLGPADGSVSVCVNEVIVHPGSSIPPHSHDCEEAVVVMEGSGRATVGDAEMPIAVRQVLLVPAGVPHGMTNTSAAETLKLLSFYPAARPQRTMV